MLEHSRSEGYSQHFRCQASSEKCHQPIKKIIYQQQQQNNSTNMMHTLVSLLTFQERKKRKCKQLETEASRGHSCDRMSTLDNGSHSSH